jgi:hypothetical protein
LETGEGYKALKTPIIGVFALLVIFVLASSIIVYAQTSIIEIHNEGSGDIINEVEGSKNLNGAMVWNGVQWVVNPTWAHKYYMDTRTGNRLKDFNSLDATVSGLPAGESDFRSDGYGKYYSPQNFGTYTITKQAYWYTETVASEKGDGSYQYGAVEYRIVDNVSNRKVILLSRGVGAGTSQAFFNVYFDDETINGAAQTTAFIEDPIWYTIPKDAVSALSLTSLSAYQTGSLPGAITQKSNNFGDYYLDIQNGADLGPAGVGKSYQLHTAPLTSKFADLSGSYVTGFELKYMDSSGNLNKIVASPTLFSEKYIPLTSTSASPNTTPSPTPTGSSSNTAISFDWTWVIIIVVLVVAILLILFLIYKKRKKKEKSKKK